MATDVAPAPSTSRTSPDPGPDRAETAHALTPPSHSGAEPEPAQAPQVATEPEWSRRAAPAATSPACADPGSDALRAPEPPGLVGVLVPLLLGTISTALGWIVLDQLAGSAEMVRAMVWATAVMMVILAWRVVLERALKRSRPGSAQVASLYAVHVALTVVVIVFNPLACIYAFVGYLDSYRFVVGRQLYVLIPVTALLMAVGQTGGFDIVVRSPLLFSGVAVVNMFLAVLMLYLSLVREREAEERDRTLAALQQATWENQSLQEELLRQARESGIDEERARLSREIHDTVAQGLVGVIRQLETVGGELDAGVAGGRAPGAGHNGAHENRASDTGENRASEADPRRRIAVAEEAARDCLVEARRAVEALAPQQLTDAGTADGLGQLVARWARTHRIVATFDADDAPCHGAHAAVLIRIAQEALANVSRHSGAQTVTVTLSGSEDEQSLQVTDDGDGFDAETITRGHGLANMAQRVEEVGGRLHLSSHSGAGTTVIATVPR